MAKNFKLGNYVPEVTVTLGEHSYALKSYSLDVERGVDEVQGRLNEAVAKELAGESAADPLDLVKMMAEQLDIILVAADPSAPEPSEVVVKAYEANETTRPDVAKLCEDLGEALRTPPS